VEGKGRGKDLGVDSRPDVPLANRRWAITSQNDVTSRGHCFSKYLKGSPDKAINIKLLLDIGRHRGI
jgi:hypothetical protein